MTGVGMSREIDALVAEHVMGWENNWDSPGRGGMWGIMDWIIEEDGSRTPVRAADFPSYSDDIAAAFEVIAKIQEGDVCCIKFNNDVPAGAWAVEIKGNNYKCEQLAYIEDRYDLPMVICLAALKLKGIRVPELPSPEEPEPEDFQGP